jgi:hypothetical protein
MDSVVREEITPYQVSPRGLPEEAVIAEAEKALASMDWDAYEKRMDEELKSAVEACARGEKGIPLDVAMQRLKQQAAVRREARVG